MSGLVATKYRSIHHFIRSLGYELQRTGGSHERYYLKSHVGGDGNLTVAHHEEIPKGTMMSILNDVSEQTGITVGRLKEMLNTE
jgi:predicted RNA binding protein YcfA (HicA-like mRNA interferase family)